MIRTGRKCSLAVLRGAVRGDHNDASVRRLGIGSYSLTDFQTCQLWHHDVKDCDCWTNRGDQFQGSRTVGRFYDLASVAQDRPKQRPHMRLIVGDQYGHHVVQETPVSECRKWAPATEPYTSRRHNARTLSNA